MTVLFRIMKKLRVRSGNTTLKKPQRVLVLSSFPDCCQDAKTGKYRQETERLYSNILLEGLDGPNTRISMLMLQ